VAVNVFVGAQFGVLVSQVPSLGVESPLLSQKRLGALAWALLARIEKIKLAQGSMNL
jgi:hypothetical protein